MKVFVYEHVTAAFPDAAASLMAEGRAMLSAITSDFQAIPGIELLTLDADHSFNELASQADYSLLIAPEFDDILERLAKQVIDLGGRLLGPSPEAIHLTADKFALHDRWLAHRIPTPSCRIWTGGTSSRLEVIKPRHGAGSQATRRGDVDAQEEWSGELIVQDYVEGTAASVALLIGPQEIVPLLPAEQILSTDGRFHYLGGRIPLPPSLAERAIALARGAAEAVPGLQGYVGVDLILGERDWAIEINPRLTTSYVGLRRLAQFNIAETMLKLVSRSSLPPISWKDCACSFHLAESGVDIHIE